MAEVIIAESISGVVITGGDAPAVIVHEEQGAVVIAGSERGIAGATYYTDTEISANVTVESGRSYRVNHTSRVDLQLDADLAEGSYFRVIGVGLGGWRVLQNAGEVIKIAGFTNSTTTGVTGYVGSANENDCAEFFKVTSDTWVVILTGGEFA